MLIANKCDAEEKRVIPTEKGQQLAKNHSISFMETSALSNINIERAFTTLTHEILLAVCPPTEEEVEKPSKGKKKKMKLKNGEHNRHGGKCC